MSIFALFFIISAFFTGKYLLNYIKRINGCFIGAAFVVSKLLLMFYILQIVNLLGLGMLDYLDDPTHILIGSFFFQIIGGIGNGINTPCTISVLSSYKEDRETYIGYFEVAAGLGALFGPLIGAILYYFGGYQAPFFSIGFIYLFMVAFFKRKADLIETNQDIIMKSSSQMSSAVSDNEIANKRVLTFCDIVSVLRSGFGLLV